MPPQVTPLQQSIVEHMSQGKLDPTPLYDLGIDPSPDARFELEYRTYLIQNMPEFKQDAILSELAARYLPQLVQRFKDHEDPTTPQTPSSSLLNQLSHTPYFVRYLKSPSTKGLAAHYARRLSTHEAWMMKAEEDAVGQVCQFLSTLFVIQDVVKVDEGVKSQLVKVLLKVRKRQGFGGTFGQEMVERVLYMLQNNFIMRPAMKTIKMQLETPIKQCGLYGCRRTIQNSGTDMRKCGRCKAALYCSVEHQKECWPEHNKLCFKVSY